MSRPTLASGGARETPAPVDRPARIVTDRPLAYTPDPIYLGVVAAVSGVAVLAGVVAAVSGVAVLAASPAVAALAAAL